jgi:hypothetical protein
MGKGLVYLPHVEDFGTTQHQKFLELSFGQSTKLAGLFELQNAASVEEPA